MIKEITLKLALSSLRQYIDQPYQTHVIGDSKNHMNDTVIKMSTTARTKGNLRKFVS